jgi:hypothetical protein
VQLTEKDKKRADFIVLYDSARLRLVELKSAKEPLDLRGVNNLANYHRRLKKAEEKRDVPCDVRSMLIYNGHETAEAAGPLDNIRGLRDEYEVYTWDELLTRNVMIYREQLQRVKAKNPTDPRVLPLWEIIQGRQGPAIGSARRKKALGSKK